MLHTSPTHSAATHWYAQTYRIALLADWQTLSEHKILYKLTSKYLWTIEQPPSMGGGGGSSIPLPEKRACRLDSK